jgi:hypothetical protein
MGDVLLVTGVGKNKTDNTGEGIETAVWRRYKGRGVGQLGDDVV